MPQPTNPRIESLLSSGQQKQHGARARYTSGCRCLLCRAANSSYERDRATARKQGDRRAMVDATRARRHMESLSRRNVGTRIVADIAQLTRTVVLRIRSGEARHIRQDTEKRILAITPDCLGDGALIDARPTWLMLDDLLRGGYTKLQIAEWLGVGKLQFSRKQVTARTAQRVRQLYTRIQAGLMRRADSVKLKEERRHA